MTFRNLTRLLLGIVMGCGLCWAQSDQAQPSLGDIARQAPQKKASKVFDDDNFQRSQPEAAPEAKPAEPKADAEAKPAAPAPTNEQVQALEKQLASAKQQRDFAATQVQIAQAQIDDPAVDPVTRGKLSKAQGSNKAALAAAEKQVADLTKQLEAARTAATQKPSDDQAGDDASKSADSKSADSKAGEAQPAASDKSQ